MNRNWWLPSAAPPMTIKPTTIIDEAPSLTRSLPRIQTHHWLRHFLSLQRGFRKKHCEHTVAVPPFSAGGRIFISFFHTLAFKLVCFASTSESSSFLLFFAFLITHRTSTLDISFLGINTLDITLDRHRHLCPPKEKPCPCPRQPNKPPFFFYLSLSLSPQLQDVKRLDRQNSPIHPTYNSPTQGTTTAATRHIRSRRISPSTPHHLSFVLLSSISTPSLPTSHASLLPSCKYLKIAHKQTLAMVWTQKRVNQWQTLTLTSCPLFVSWGEERVFLLFLCVLSFSSASLPFCRSTRHPKKTR